MKKTSSSRKSAFSLIELSIVLIIIGLLIAGVTGGASLIRSSELRAVISEARGYAVAVNSFYTQFNAYPGDYSTVVGNSLAGDADNTIEYYGAASAAGSESANAWVILRTIGAIDTLTNVATPVIATTEPVFGTTAPSSKIKSAGWLFDYRLAGVASTQFTSETSSQNVVVLTAVPTTDPTADTHTVTKGTNIALAAIYATDALSIDTKVDDANPGSGTIRGLNPGSGAVVSATAGTLCYYAGTLATLSTYLYNTAYTTKACALTYQVDVSSSS